MASTVAVEVVISSVVKIPLVVIVSVISVLVTRPVVMVRWSLAVWGGVSIAAIFTSVLVVIPAVASIVIVVHIESSSVVILIVIAPVAASTTSSVVLLIIVIEFGVIFLVSFVHVIVVISVVKTLTATPLLTS